MSVSNKTNYNKNKKFWKIKKKKTLSVATHTCSVLFATIFNAILFKKLALKIL